MSSAEILDQHPLDGLFGNQVPTASGQPAVQYSGPTLNDNGVLGKWVNDSIGGYSTGETAEQRYQRLLSSAPVQSSTAGTKPSGEAPTAPSVDFGGFVPPGESNHAMNVPGAPEVMYGMPVSQYRGAAPAMVQGNTNAATAVNYFTSQGWTPAQAAGIVGSLQQESYANLRTDVNGDSKAAYGIAQWHSDRLKNFQSVTGKPVEGSGLADQLAYVQWELTHSEKAAGDKIRQAQDAGTAAEIAGQYYERAGVQASQKRIDNALKLLKSGDFSEYDRLPLNHQLDLLDAQTGVKISG